MPSSLTNLLYHVVFSTKGRQPEIVQGFMEDLYAYIGGIIRSEKGKMIEIGGTSNHVHILARFSPAISVSEMLKMIKGNSSRWVNKSGKRPTRFAWQKGYGAFSVSESGCESGCEAVVNYIRNQEAHHRKMTFKEEFKLLLDKHQVEYDEEYLWD